jgi:nitric oxide reductase subunit B
VVAGSGRRELLVSRGWVQAVVLTLLFGFLVLGIMGYGTYSGQPPIPEKIVDQAGETVFTGEDIREGQKVFLRNGLMEYGSVFGHGGYLGPDYTADYLHRAALAVRDRYGGSGSDRAAARTVEDFKQNRYDSDTRTLEFTEAQTVAFGDVAGHYGRYFGEPTTRYGLRPGAITDPKEIEQLTAFFAWSAWAAAAERPGESYSYTNDWPPEPLVGNEATGNTVV